MVIDNGYCGINIPLTHALAVRSANITFGVKNNTGGSNPDTIATAVQTAIMGATNIKSIIDNSVTIGPVRCALGQSDFPPLIGVASSSGLGTRSGTAPPPNVAVLVKKRTATGGRTGLGRMFLPWATDEGSIDEIGKLTGAEVTLIQNAVNVLLSSLSTATLPMCVLHQQGTQLAYLVTGLTVDPLVATQRRRLGR